MINHMNSEFSDYVQYNCVFVYTLGMYGMVYEIVYILQQRISKINFDLYYCGTPSISCVKKFGSATSCSCCACNEIKRMGQF